MQAPYRLVPAIANVQVAAVIAEGRASRHQAAAVLGLQSRGPWLPARLACPAWLTVKEAIWLALGSVTSMTLPSGLNEISAGEAALPLGSDCVEPTIGTSVFDACASGTIRKPVMLGVPPRAFSTYSRSWCTVRADRLRPS